MSTVRHDPPHRGYTTNAPSEESGIESKSAEFLSIIVPAKNEAASLRQLIGEIAQAFRPLADRKRRGESNPLGGFEILIVDDGSTDDSLEVLHAVRAETPELRVLSLAQNVGQTAATLAGFRAARGDWVAVLDADLQNPPAELAKLWDVLPGYDVALGWRAKREDVWWKRIMSKWANRARNAALGQSIKDTGCSVRIFPREAALRLPMFRGAHRFLGPLLLREGCSVIQSPVEHRPRTHGTSHYRFWNRSIQVVADLIGVAWLMRRPVRYEIATVDPPFDALSPRTSVAIRGREAIRERS